MCCNSNCTPAFLQLDRIRKTAERFFHIGCANDVDMQPSFPCFRRYLVSNTAVIYYYLTGRL